MKSILKIVALFVMALMVGVVQATPVSGQGTWEANLLSRDLDGNGVTDAFYDVTLKITWLANVSSASNWDAAQLWAGNLTFGGYTDWRLPTMENSYKSGCDFSYAGGTDCGYNVRTAASEVANLWYISLGNKSSCDPATSNATDECGEQAGAGLTNTGQFFNLVSGYYWFGTEFEPDYVGIAWSFAADVGAQIPNYKYQNFLAIAVRDGDVGTGTELPSIPEPESLALVGIALAGLGLTRRKSKVLVAYAQ